LPSKKIIKFFFTVQKKQRKRKNLFSLLEKIENKNSKNLLRFFGPFKKMKNRRFSEKIEIFLKSEKNHNLQED